MDTIIYGADGCSYCLDLKRKLKELNIQFEYVDILTPSNRKYLDQIIKVTGSDDIPVVKQGNRLYAPNSSYNSLEHLIELIKNI